MKKFTKILSGMLAVSLATSAFVGFTVANAEADTVTKEIVLYENDFSHNFDGVSSFPASYTCNTMGSKHTGHYQQTKSAGRLTITDGMLTLTDSEWSGVNCDQNPIHPVEIAFDQQSSGVIIAEFKYKVAGGTTACSTGMVLLENSAGENVAGWDADGRGDGSPVVDGSFLGNAATERINNGSWVPGIYSLKLELNLDSDTYTISGTNINTANATNLSCTNHGSVSKLKLMLSSNGDAIDDIKIYKKLSVTQTVKNKTFTLGGGNVMLFSNSDASAMLYAPGMQPVDFTYTSSDANVIRIAPTGLMQIRGKGNATITATHKTYNEMSFTYNMSVKDPATGIAITGDSHNSYVGQTKQLRYTLTPEDTAVTGVSWSSDNASVATVDENGLVTAGTTAGSATITVTATVPSGTITDTCTINVSVPLDALVITGDNRVMVRNKMMLSAESKIVDFTPGTLTWSLDSAPAGTSINPTTGEVTAGDTAGNAVAKASCFGGLVFATYQFEVYAPADGLKIRDKKDVYELDIDNNDEITLDVIVLGGFTPDTISWTKPDAPADNTITLTPSADGRSVTIKADQINPTGVKVRVSCYNGSVKDEFTVKVHRGVGTITVSGTQAVLDIGDRVTVTGAWANANTTVNTNTALSWRSGNHYVATVSGSGTSAVVTAVGAGTTQIYFMGAGQQGSFTVTVNPKTDAYGNVVEDTRSPARVSFAEVKGSFSDIADMAWAQAAIQNVYANGVMTPDSEYFFGAKRNIKRDEFVSVVIKTLGLDGSVSEDAKKFDDVDESNPYYAEIMKAVELGIIAGVSDTSFAPADDITRQDLSLVVMKALEAADIDIVEGRLDFNDKADIAEYAQKAVRVLSKMNIMVGKEGGNFDPRANTTRAEAAVISEKIAAIR